MRRTQVAIVCTLALIALAIAGERPEPQGSCAIEFVHEGCLLQDTVADGCRRIVLVCPEHGDTLLIALVWDHGVDPEMVKLKMAVRETDDELDDLKRALEELKQQKALEGPK